MNPCEKYELWINLYADGLLPSEDARSLEQHLKECRACREYYEQISEMKEALSQLEEPVPEGLHEQIMSYVEKNGSEADPAALTAPVRKKRPLKRWLSAAAAIAACAILSVTAVQMLPSLDNASGLEMEPGAAEPEQLQDNLLPVEPEAPRPAPETPSEPIVPEKPKHSADETVPPPDSVEDSYLSADLPPEGSQNTHDSEEKNGGASIRAVIQVKGNRSDLPTWIDWSKVYQSEFGGTVHDYIEIAGWAEQYWLDQLEASGFALREMESDLVSEDGENLVLVFYWKSEP